MLLKQQQGRLIAKSKKTTPLGGVADKNYKTKRSGGGKFLQKFF